MGVNAHYSRAFSLATCKNDYLPYIGQKGRVPVDGRKPCKEMLALSNETLQETVRKNKKWLQEIRGERASNYE